MIELADNIYESRDFETLGDFIPKEIKKKYLDFVKNFPLKSLKELIIPLKYLDNLSKLTTVEISMAATPQLPQAMVVV